LTTIESSPIFGILIRATASPSGGGGGAGEVVLDVVELGGTPAIVVVVVLDDGDGEVSEPSRTRAAWNCCSSWFCSRAV
jgi:hypothetical protein